MSNGRKALQAIIENLESVDLNIKLNKKMEAVGEINGIKIYNRPVRGSIIACITISQETNRPIILVDDLFFLLTPTCMKFVLLHEIGHYNLGHFIPKLGKEAKVEFKNKIITSIKREYPRQEQDADYYAMYKMDSVEDAVNALTEIQKIIEKFYINQKFGPEVIAKLRKRHEKRLYALKRNAVQGAYYIKQESNENNKIEIPEDKLENSEKIASFCKETFDSLIQPKDIKSFETDEQIAEFYEDEIISYPLEFEIEEELTDEQIAEFYEDEISNLDK